MDNDCRHRLVGVDDDADEEAAHVANPELLRGSEASGSGESGISGESLRGSGRIAQGTGSSQESTYENASDVYWGPCNEIQDHDVGNATQHFERDKLLGHGKIPCSTFPDLSNSKGSSIPVSLESSTSDYTVEKMQFTSQVAADSFVSLNQAAHVHKLESTLDIMSELCETKEHAEVEKLSCHVSDVSTMRENISDQDSILMNVPKSFPLQSDKEGESTKLVSETNKNNVDGHADDSDDLLRMSDNNKVEENIDKINCSSVMNLIEVSELSQSNFEQSLASVHSEAKKEAEYNQEGKTSHLLLSDFAPLDSAESTNVGSSCIQPDGNKWLQDEYEDKNLTAEVRDNVIEGIGCICVETFTCIKEIHDETKSSLAGTEAVEGFNSDWRKVHLNSVLDASLTGATSLSYCNETDISHLHSEAVQAWNPSEKDSVCIDLSQEDMPINNVVEKEFCGTVLPASDKAVKENNAKGNNLIVEDIQLYCDGFCKMKVKYTCEDDHTLYDSVVGTGSRQDPSNLNTLPEEDGEVIVKVEPQWSTTSSFSTISSESKVDAVCSLNIETVSPPPACQIGDQKLLQPKFTKFPIDNFKTQCSSSQIETEGKDVRLECSSSKCQNGISYETQNENVSNTCIFYSSEMIQKKDDDGTSNAILVGNDSKQARMQFETEITHGVSSSFTSPSREESTLNATDDDNCSFISSISKESVITEYSKTCEVSEAVVSFSCFQPSINQTDISLSNQQPDKTAKPAIVTTLMDILVDSNTLSDSAEGQWGYISGAQASCVLPSSQTSTDAVTHKDTDESVGSFEAPSFMTLVNPSMRTDSCEIQLMEKPQLESLGKKINEEAIAKVANWSPAKPYTPLRDLLIEANFENRQKSGSVKHHQVSPRTMKVESRKEKTLVDETKGNSLEPSNGADQKEWNSPARLPDKSDKREKRSHSWFPFICCTSIN